MTDPMDDLRQSSAEVSGVEVLSPNRPQVLNDISRCHGIDCHQKHQCARHVAPVPDKMLLSWVTTMNPERAHLCPGFIAAELKGHG